MKADAHPWRMISGVMGLAGRVSEAVEQERSDRDTLLAQLSVSEVLGRCASDAPDVAGGMAAWIEIKALTGRLADRLPEVVAGPGDQAILCWYEYLDSGDSVRSVGRRVQRRVTPPWRAPDKTVRERMWLSQREVSSRVSRTALPGLLAIAGAWEITFDVELGQGRSSLLTVPRMVSRGMTLFGDRAHFVTDVTVPDGSILDPGELIVKTWRLKNAGMVTWEGRRLARVGPCEGDDLPTTPPWVPIDDTGPGETVDISVPITLPQSPGTYKLTFKMTDERGEYFFPDRYKNGIYSTLIVRGSN